MLAAVSQAALVLATELWHWLALISVLSVCIPASLTCLMCCVFHRHPAHEWDQRQNNLLMVQAVAAVGGLAIASYFPGELAAGGMLLGAGIMFASALIALFTAPGYQAFQAVKQSPVSVSSAASITGSLPSVFWVVMVAWVLVNTANNLFFYSYSPVMDQVFGIGPSVSPLIIGGASALGLLVYPKIGDICQRVNAFHLLSGAFTVAYLCGEWFIAGHSLSSCWYSANAVSRVFHYVPVSAVLERHVYWSISSDCQAWS